MAKFIINKGFADEVTVLDATSVRAGDQWVEFYAGSNSPVYIQSASGVRTVEKEGSAS